MVEAANRFLASLTPEQRAKATFPFETGERQNWHFVPIERKGLALREMTPAQKHLATGLLAAGLSQQGLLKAESIMSLEDVLKAIETAPAPNAIPRNITCPYSARPRPTARGDTGWKDTT